MDEQQLAAIRQANASNGGKESEDDGKRESEEQMRRDLLATVLDSPARERRETTPISLCLALTIFSQLRELRL